MEQRGSALWLPPGAHQTSPSATAGGMSALSRGTRLEFPVSWT